MTCRVSYFNDFLTTGKEEFCSPSSICRAFKGKIVHFLNRVSNFAKTSFSLFHKNDFVAIGIAYIVSQSAELCESGQWMQLFWIFQAVIYFKLKWYYFGFPVKTYPVAPQDDLRLKILYGENKRYMKSRKKSLFFSSSFSFFSSKIFKFFLNETLFHSWLSY